MWTLGDLLGLSEGGADTERIPRTGLTLHKEYKTGRTCILNAVQSGDG